jgi:hypothetical protein
VQKVISIVVELCCGNSGQQLIENGLASELIGVAPAAGMGAVTSGFSTEFSKIVTQLGGLVTGMLRVLCGSDQA